jgi:hypothetical protein
VIYPSAANFYLINLFRYLLNKAAVQTGNGQACRLLNSLGNQVVRFFLHACMYLACGDIDEHQATVLQSLILTTPDNVKEFFWQHMERDLQVSCQLLNITTDEILILLHSICFGFVKSTSKSSIALNSSANFGSKGGRQNWEHSFYKTYLAPVFAASFENIAQANGLIKRFLERDDSKQSKVYFMAYELIDETKSQVLYENERLWKFRPLVSFGFMVQEMNMQTTLEHHKVLKQFGRLAGSLELVFELPRIVGLVNMLRRLLGISIFKYKAQASSIGELIGGVELPAGWSVERVEKCLESFQLVWNTLKTDIHKYGKFFAQI